LATAFFAGADVARGQEWDDDEPTANRDISSIADAHAQFPFVFGTSSDDDVPGNILVFGGVDGWKFGASAYLGAEWSQPIESGFAPILRMFAADGLDDFKTRFETYRSETARASLLLGIRFQAEKLDVKVFLGGDYMMRIPLRPAVETPVQLFGARATLETWWEPSEQWMLSGSASATTIESGLSARVAAGWRLPFAWIGPEVLATHDIFNTQLRAGAHLTGFRLGVTEWSVAGGYTRDNFGRSSPYGRIGITLRP
jgi:hypothetical protein